MTIEKQYWYRTSIVICSNCGADARWRVRVYNKDEKGPHVVCKFETCGFGGLAKGALQ